MHSTFCWVFFESCVSEYTSEKPNQAIEQVSEEWKAVHVRESHFFLQIVKCDDRKCCSPFQSSYRTLIRDRFLPPPIPLSQSVSGLKWAKSDSSGAIYLSLTQNLAMRDTLKTESMSKKFKDIPYDYSNPAVSPETLKKRICSTCELMFGAIKGKEEHQKMCTKKKSKQTNQIANSFPVTSAISSSDNTPIRPIRPSRVKARRGLELLCLIEDDTLDWYDFDEVNTEGLVIPPELRAKHGTPVLEDNDPIWENIE